MSASYENEDGYKYQQWKTWAFIAYALVVIVICLCLFVSVKESPVHTLVPDSVFAAVSINLDEDANGTENLLSSLETLLLQGDVSRVRRFIIKRVISFLPERIIVLAAAGSGAEPEVVMIVKMGAVIRLAKLFPGQIDRVFFEGQDVKKKMINGHRVKYTENKQNKLGLAAYTYIGKTYIAGSSYEILESSLASHVSTNNGDKDTWRITPHILRGIDRSGFFLFADNSSGDLSNIVGYVEERYAFALFPSVDGVEIIHGTITLSENEVLGQITVLGNDAGTLNEVRSDVRYLYGAMRRVLKPRNITLEGDVQIERSRVLFEFSVSDYTSAIINNFREKQGGSE